MRGKVNIPFWLVLAVAAVVFAGCGEQQSSEGGRQDRSDIRIVVVTHGQSGNPFWSSLETGATQAGEDLGVEVEYSSTQQFDPVEQAKLLDAAVATDPDGIAVSIPDEDALRGPIKDAQDAGIPLVALNQGVDVYEQLGISTFVSQDEFGAGVEAGERLKSLGVNSAYCVNPAVGNPTLDSRCEGVKEGLGGDLKVVGVSYEDPSDTQAKIEAAMQQDPDVDGMVTIGPTEAEPALAALEETGKMNDLTLATFDLSPEILQAVKNGNMAFAIDQQQYLQGYLPVVFLTKYIEYGVMPQGVMSTGPEFVTQEDATEVIKLAEDGIR